MPSFNGLTILYLLIQSYFLPIKMLLSLGKVCHNLRSFCKKESLSYILYTQAHQRMTNEPVMTYLGYPLSFATLEAQSIVFQTILTTDERFRYVKTPASIGVDFLFVGKGAQCYHCRQTVSVTQTVVRSAWPMDDYDALTCTEEDLQYNIVSRLTYYGPIMEMDSYPSKYEVRRTYCELCLKDTIEDQFLKVRANLECLRQSILSQKKSDAATLWAPIYTARDRYWQPQIKKGRY
jgi:hypothetical protein